MDIRPFVAKPYSTTTGWAFTLPMFLVNAKEIDPKAKYEVQLKKIERVD